MWFVDEDTRSRLAVNVTKAPFRPSQSHEVKARPQGCACMQPKFQPCPDPPSVHTGPRPRPVRCVAQHV